MDLRIRPKTDFLQHSDWQELYILSKHWLSDLEFYQDEQRFLRLLIGKYFMWLNNDGNISRVNELAIELNRLLKDKKELSTKVKLHMNHLEALMQNAFSVDEHEFRNEHEELEDQLCAFVKDFKVLKRNIFAATEDVVGEEKLDHLMV